MKNKQLIFGTLVGVVCVYLFAGMVVDSRLGSLKDYLENIIDSQKVVVREVVKNISEGGGTNDKIAAAIPECPVEEMNQYDSLLSTLDSGLSKYELQGLNILFKRCGHVVASRRAGMVMVFEYELKNLSELVAARDLLGGYPTQDVNLSKLETLLGYENEITQIYFELVDSQREIISILAGEGKSSSTVEDIQIKVAEQKNLMKDVTAKATELRAILASS